MNLIITDGDGDKLLSDDGTYKEVVLKIDPSDKVLEQSTNGILANVSIQKIGTPDADFAAQYKLVGKDGTTALGVTIDILKDQLFKDVSFVHSATQADVDLAATRGSVIELGYTYICFEFELSTGDKWVYLDVSDLVDEYTAGNTGIDVADYKVSLVVDPSSHLEIGSNGLRLKDSAFITGEEFNELVEKLFGSEPTQTIGDNRFSSGAGPTPPCYIGTTNYSHIEGKFIESAQIYFNSINTNQTWNLPFYAIKGTDIGTLRFLKSVVLISGGNKTIEINQQLEPGERIVFMDETTLSTALPVMTNPVIPTPLLGKWYSYNVATGLWVTGGDSNIKYTVRNIGGIINQINREKISSIETMDSLDIELYGDGTENNPLAAVFHQDVVLETDKEIPSKTYSENIINNDPFDGGVQLGVVTDPVSKYVFVISRAANGGFSVYKPDGTVITPILTSYYRMGSVFLMNGQICVSFSKTSDLSEPVLYQWNRNTEIFEYVADTPVLITSVTTIRGEFKGLITSFSNGLHEIDYSNYEVTRLIPTMITYATVSILQSRKNPHLTFIGTRQGVFCHNSRHNEIKIVDGQDSSSRFDYNYLIYGMNDTIYGTQSRTVYAIEEGINRVRNMGSVDFSATFLTYSSKDNCLYGLFKPSSSSNNIRSWKITETGAITLANNVINDSSIIYDIYSGPTPEGLDGEIYVATNTGIQILDRVNGTLSIATDFNTSNPGAYGQILSPIENQVLFLVRDANNVNLVEKIISQNIEVAYSNIYGRRHGGWIDISNKLDAIDTIQTNIEGFVKLESPTTQVIDSNLTLTESSKLMLQRSNGTHENAISLGVYGTYEQEEIGSETDPTCLNHNAKASDGTVVGKNIIVNYKDEDGVNKADSVAYLTDITSYVNNREIEISAADYQILVDNNQVDPTKIYFIPLT